MNQSNGGPGGPGHRPAPTGGAGSHETQLDRIERKLDQLLAERGSWGHGGTFTPSAEEVADLRTSDALLADLPPGWIVYSEGRGGPLHGPVTHDITLRSTVGEIVHAQAGTRTAAVEDAIARTKPGVISE